MDNLDNILELIKFNEKTALKFNKVETKILSILNFKDFFEVLLTDIIISFQIPFVWLTVIEETDFSEMLDNIESKLVKNHLKLIKKDDFYQYIKDKTKPLLINDGLKKYSKFIQKDILKPVKSIAIAPISIDGKLIGSLNQGDISVSRFQPGIDTSLLEQLTLKVSLCLSNVTAHEKLKFLAYHDPLTGLLNRRIMETALKREFERTKRYNSPLSVIFSDLDNFKIINDKYGHDIGDKILIFIADSLKGNSRSTEIVSRFAGDEFVIILPETDLKAAKYYVQRAEDFFKTTPLKIGNEKLFISLSFGIASTDSDEASDALALLKIADEDLYVVKKEKKNI
ncbi:MAG: sensor domain-containing diguanylate cyclase [Desulfobacterales bacterium]|nr:sensor domain-containing diguanylate cyclase [Desulfobacterales bacterium]